MARASCLLVTVLLGGCAGYATVSAPASPERISQLESALERSQGSPDSRLQLALAYQSAGRAQDAITTLEPVAVPGSEDPAVLYLLALSYESAGRLAEARQAYEAYLTKGVSRRLDRRTRARIALLERREMQQAVRAAIAREEEVRGVAPDPATVAVFPFVAGDLDAEYAPLSRALAEFMTVDLSQTGRLRVLERARLQVLLDEQQLGVARVAEPGTAARAGRLLGAGRIVQGRVDGDAAGLRLQSLVVAVAAAADSTSAPIREDGPVEQLFDMQKRMAVSLYGRLGIQLTAAERERVLNRHTDNVQALLAFGFGLESHDADRYSEAARWFGQALDADGAFELARLWLERSELLEEATRDEEELDELAEVELGWDLPGWMRRRLPFIQIDPLVPDPDVRDPGPEFFGVEGLDRRARVNVIIRPPGGN